MAKVACPRCKKRYDVPEQMLGHVATCKCGNKFRLGDKPSDVAFGAPKVAEPPEPSDSFWDEALAEPPMPAGLDAVAAEFGAEVARPLTVAKRAAEKSGDSAPWKFAADMGFRVVALAAPFLIWRMAYNSLSESMDEDSIGGPMLYSTVLFLVTLVFGVTLAKYGIGFDRGSMRHRLTGLGLMLGGILSAVVGIAVSVGLSYVTSGAGFVVIGGFVFGLVVFFIGMLQFVTGRDLKSESIHTRDL